MAKWSEVDELVEKIYSECYGTMPNNIDGTHGREKKIKKDTITTLSYLKIAYQTNTKSVFINYMVWLLQLFHHLDLNFENHDAYFEIIHKVIRDHFEDDLGILTIFEAGVSAFKDEANRINHDSIVLDEANQDILNDLLAFKRIEASDKIIALHEKGMQIKTIYNQVLTPILRKVGELWHENRINVAKEHYTTAVLQSVMSRLYPYIFSAGKKQKKLLSLSAGEELHEIGIRMITDLFELDGWDTVYLGSNLPHSCVLDELENSHYDLLCISTTLAINIKYAKDLITSIRSTKSLSHLKIMVGGYAYLQNKDLWRKIGADFYAKDSDDAMLQAGGINE